MTVKELAEKLKGMPQDARVFMESARHYNGIESIFVDSDGDVVLSEFDD